MSWPLYNEVSKNNTRNYSVFRCVDPTAVVTGAPWFNNENVCPCDPKLSNSSGRGFTACPMGVQEKTPMWNVSNSQLYSEIPEKNQIQGSMFNQNQFVPPQLQPRQLVRIGEEWRSSN